MEAKTSNLSENSLDLDFFASTESLSIEYSPEQRQSAIADSNSKWQQFKSKLDDLKRNLPSFIIHKIEKERIEKFNTNLTTFLKSQSNQAIHDYKMFASLDLAFQQNANLLDYNNVMKGLSELVKDYYLGMNSNLLAIGDSDFQNRIIFEVPFAFVQGDLDLDKEALYLLESEQSNKDQISEKKLVKTELVGLLSRFEEILLAVFQEKMNSMLLRLRGATEIICNELLEEISSFAARILAKLNSFGSDAAGSEELNLAIDEFFSSTYLTELSFLQTKLIETVNSENIQKAENRAIEQVIKDFHTMNNITAPKIPLGEYFFKEKAAVILLKVPPTCLKLVQESKTSKLISVLDVEDHLEMISRDQKPFVIKYNHTYLVSCDPLSATRSADDPELIFYTTNEELVNEYRMVEAKLGFFPPNLEFPKEETMILYFMVKLVKFIQAKEEMNEKSLENNVLIVIGI